MSLNGRMIRRVIVVCAVAVIVGHGTCGADAPVINGFRGTFLDVMVLTDGAVYVATSQGLYKNDGDFRVWTAACPLHDVRNVAIAGGSAKTVWVVIEDSQTAKDQTTVLATFSPDKGLSNIRRIPKQPCAFASETRGALSTGSLVCTTTDGGKTWSAPQSAMPGREPIKTLCWLDESNVVAASETGVVVSMNMANDGSVKSQWVSHAHQWCPSFAEAKGLIWTGSDPVVGLDKAKGATTRTLKPDVVVDGVGALADRIWTWGPENVAVWNARDPAEAARSIKTDAIRKAFPRPAGDAVLVTLDGKFMTWDGQAAGPTPLAIQVDNSAIDKAAAVKPATQGGEKATPDEVRAMNEWALKAGMEGQAEVMQRAAGKTDLTPRQRVLWITAELKRYVEEHKSSTPQ